MGFSAAFSAGFAHDPPPAQPTGEGPAPPAAPPSVPRLCDSNLLLTGARVLVEARKVRALPLYQAIVIRCGDKGVAWPSVTTLCADLGCSPATIKRRVADLVASGLVLVQRRRNSSQVYKLTRRAGHEPMRLVDKVVDNTPGDTPAEIRNGHNGDRSGNGHNGDRSGTVSNGDRTESSIRIFNGGNPRIFGDFGGAGGFG